MKRNENAVKLAIAVSALLAGIAFGHWATAPAAALVARATSLPNESNAEAATSVASSSPTATVAEATKSRRGANSLLRILQDRRSGHGTRELTDYVNQLPAAEFATALLATRKLPRGSDRDLATQLLVARWAETDPDGALAFAASHKQFDEITGEVFQQLASGDLQSALTRAQALADPTMRYQALRGTLSVMAEQDPSGALQLAGTFDDLPHTEPLTQSIYREWSSTDPLAAATKAAQDSSSTSWRSPLGQVLRTWASEDPEGALNYALTMNDPSAQAHSVTDIVRRWSDQDPGAAANWINTMPAGPARDAAAAALASSVASSDPTAAVGWAQSIGDEGMRTSALQRVSRRVLWRDPTNGAATLQSAGVPAAILQDMPSPGR